MRIEPVQNEEESIVLDRITVAVASCGAMLYRILLRAYWRFNAIIGFVVLLPVDFMLYKTTELTWKQTHDPTMRAVRESWNKY